MWFQTPSSKKRRLITGILPDRANDVIRDLEDRGFVVLTVIPRLVPADNRSLSIMLTIYDLFVEGDGDPMWGIWGQHGS